jgi:hypothetical protein
MSEPETFLEQLEASENSEAPALAIRYFDLIQRNAEVHGNVLFELRGQVDPSRFDPPKDIVLFAFAEVLFSYSGQPLPDWADGELVSVLNNIEEATAEDGPIVDALAENEHFAHLFNQRERTESSRPSRTRPPT